MVNQMRDFFNDKSNRIYIAILLILILGAATDGVGYARIAAILYLAAIIIGILAWNKNRTAQRKGSAVVEYKGTFESNPIIKAAQMIESGELPVISCNSMTGDSEITHFQCQAIRYVTSRFLSSRKAPAKAVNKDSLKVVGLQSRGKRGTASEAYGSDAFLGEFVLTDKRLLFNHKQHGFYCELDEIDNIDEAAHGRTRILRKGDACLLYLVVDIDGETGKTAIIDNATPLLSKAIALIRE